MMKPLPIPLLISLALTLPCHADPALAGAKPEGGVLQLLTFEPDELASISEKLKTKERAAKLSDDTPTQIVSSKQLGAWTITTGDASEGEQSLILPKNRTHRFKRFKVPDAALDYYGIDQDHYRQCLRTAGVFRRLFPMDWSTFEELRFDVSARDVPVTVRIALEDEEIAPPIVRSFRVEPGSWQTCVVDLRRAAKERGLELRRMATLSIAAVEIHGDVPSDAPWLARLDHLRLTPSGHPADRKLLRDESSHALPPLYQPSAGPAPERLPAGKPDHSPIAVTEPITIPTDRPYAINMPGWIAAYDNAHLLVGFSGGGTTAGRTGILQTSDGGKTWTGLDGADKPSWIPTPYPDHQAARGNVVGRRSDVVLFTNLGCNGQKMSSLRLFSRQLEFDGKGWKLREQPALVDCDLRHCNSNQSVIRCEDGRLWAAYGLVGRLGRNCINARYSDDDGITWKSVRPGTSGLIPGTIQPEGKSVGFGTYNFEEPSIVPYGNGIACIWQMGRGPLKWTHFDGERWAPIEEIAQPEGTAYNPTRPGISAVHTDDGDLFFVSARFDGVYHRTGGKWVLEATDVPGGSRICVAGGKTVAVISTGIRESRSYRSHQGPVAFSMWKRRPDGSWDTPKKVFTEKHPLTRNDNQYGFRPAFVVLPYSPPNCIPIAWTCDDQSWIRVLRIPVAPTNK